VGRCRGSYSRHSENHEQGQVQELDQIAERLRECVLHLSLRSSATAGSIAKRMVGVSSWRSNGLKVHCPECPPTRNRSECDSVAERNIGSVILLCRSIRRIGWADATTESLGSRIRLGLGQANDVAPDLSSSARCRLLASIFTCAKLGSSAPK